MSWKLRVLVPALLLAPQAAMALGLGDIRLDSGLNEPLAAEIDLVAAAPEEIAALEAKLATREMFQRYGLERPQYLDTLQFRVGKSSDGRSVLLVRSQAPITEPAVTFLVEASWSSGRLLREYTLLLDPPMAEPSRAPGAVDMATTVAAPPVAPAAPAAAPTPAVEAEPAAAAAGIGQPGAISVQRNDTLYGIASRLAQGPRATNQMVIALYRANPQAFGGNINRLKAGAELRVPEPDAVAGVSSAEAAREIAEQTAVWRASRDASARLRLVPPREGEVAAPVAADGASAEEVRRLQQELAESRRLLELKNQELAELQARAAAKPAEAAAPPVEAPVAPQDDIGAKPVPEPAPEPEAAPAEPPKPVKPPKRARPAAAAEPGLLDSLASNWTWLLGALAALVGGLAVFGYIRRRREEQEGESMAAFTPPPEPPVADDATRLRAYQPAPRDGLIVEEPRLPARGPATAAAAATGAARLEDTMSAEAAVNLDQTDPLAEADFHMAYGLYDQAADLMRLALEREPDRRDFKLKLLEIFFVWGNKQRFVETARELYNTKAQGAAGEWDRVAIMGRQIAPGESMFVGAPTAGAASGDIIDLNLGSGDNRVDIDVFAPAGGDAVDLDLGDALGGADSSADTGRNQALDFDLDLSETTANGETATIEMPAAPSEGHTITLDVVGPNAPTVEQPRLRGAALPTDATGVLSSEDLGLDLAALEALVDAPDAGDFGGASTTLVATGGATEPTRIQPQPRHDTAITAELPAVDATSAMEGFDLDMGDATVEATQKIRTDATGIINMTGVRPLDLDVGGMIDPTEQTATHRLSLQDLASSDLEPVTMSEVGTKLDLARAYVDMGDPEGARSILQEVLAEGSAGQKQEAQRLLDSLPGNA